MNNIAIRTSAKPFIDRVKFPYGFKKSGDFSISEANLLSLYGRTLNALETGELQAESEDEKTQTHLNKFAVDINSILKDIKDNINKMVIT